MLLLLVFGVGTAPAGEAPAAAEPSAGLGDLPRHETLIVDILTGRVGTPDDFNNWVGWKWRDRGMQNLANEPLWSVDFATGKIIPGLATGDPVYNDDFTALTIPLREGVTWDDGQPFTAADVVFTVETLMKHSGLVEQASEQEIADASAQADRTGLFNCPHTGVALAAMLKFHARGEIKGNDRVVVISTAHGLKFGNVKADYHTAKLPGIAPRFANPPTELPADTTAVYDAVMRHVERDAARR